jgi:hypothetical protein
MQAIALRAKKFTGPPVELHSWVASGERRPPSMADMQDSHCVALNGEKKAIDMRPVAVEQMSHLEVKASLSGAKGQRWGSCEEMLQRCASPQTIAARSFRHSEKAAIPG